MVETSHDSSLLDRIRSKPNVSTTHRTDQDPRDDQAAIRLPVRHAIGFPTTSAEQVKQDVQASTADNAVDEVSSPSPPPGPPPPLPLQDGEAEASPTIEPAQTAKRYRHFFSVVKQILFSSSVNLLLIFVPVGIAVHFAGVNPTIVFALNAIAIIPLAGLLTYATKAVASTMGDAVGALMNVTFGNAVELIIFVALVKNEIRIVQASLLGSILANLLLILGMAFLFGGLRFREQLYNKTITQMSACLLSLSVMSLLLPTAFHASFDNNDAADRAVLQVSRGSSVILLIVYVLYLLFQLKSHAYMYVSTPQHVIDEESHPGVLADMLGSSSSSDSADSSRDSDTEGSSVSNTTAKRIKRALRRRRRRRVSTGSKETPSSPSAARTPSVETALAESSTMKSPVDTTNSHSLGVIASGDEADTDGEQKHRGGRLKESLTFRRDFEHETEDNRASVESPDSKSKKKCKKKRRRKRAEGEDNGCSDDRTRAVHAGEALVTPPSPHVTFVRPDVPSMMDGNSKRPFNLRNISVLPTMPKLLTSTVFSTVNPTGLPSGSLPAPAVPLAPYSLRRASSLPDRLNRPARIPVVKPVLDSPTNGASTSRKADADTAGEQYISRTSAVVLLLVTTGLVAVCAEFLVGSINYLVENSNVSEAFIGLIILPIVGNAAEHVTAVTVASQNKMDLAIHVAVGSSIQIALFVTPVVVLLGWALHKTMSLYFSLFETISLFGSAFIVNFLVLDGRTNYLEGALLIAAYIIIALAAFFYPSSSELSTVG